MKRWADANRNKVNTNARNYLTTANGRANALISTARGRAKAKGVPFLLTKECVVAGIERGFCAKTFFPFHLDLLPTEGRSYHMHPFSPSIDKIEPSGLYEDSNVQIVCSWYNLAKGQHTEQQLIEFCKRVALIDALQNPI